jgi:AraC-like DNA-binding protein
MQACSKLFILFIRMASMVFLVRRLMLASRLRVEIPVVEFVRRLDGFHNFIDGLALVFSALLPFGKLPVPDGNGAHRLTLRTWQSQNPRGGPGKPRNRANCGEQVASVARRRLSRVQSDSRTARRHQCLRVATGWQARSDCSGTEVAHRCGFATVQYLLEVWKRELGWTRCRPGRLPRQMRTRPVIISMARRQVCLRR